MSAHTLDTTRLNTYLSDQIDQFHGLEKVEKFSDGQSNPTYLLHSKSGFYVLRMQPMGTLLKSAHAVDREFRVIQALQRTEVPVPEAIHLCEDKSIIGTLFFIMSYEPGRVFWRPDIVDINIPQRTQIYAEMNRILAALHEIDVVATGLQDYGRPGNYFERQINRWTQQYRASEIGTIAEMDTLINWLPKNIPVDNGMISLIHGDYRIDNIIFDQHQTHAKALLDWELSTLDHPFADLAYQCMQWRLPQDCVIPGLGDIDRKPLGIPTEEEYINQYCQLRGLSGITDWPFYLAFSFFRFAAILQGVMKRAIDGNASSSKAFEYGKLAPVLAKMTVEIVDK